VIRSKLFEEGEWIKGQDFIDGSPRYRLVVPGVIEGEGYFCDSYDSPLRWHVLVVQEREREYRGGPIKTVYYTVAEDCKKEARIEGGPFRFVRDARRSAEQDAIDIMAKAQGKDI